MAPKARTTADVLEIQYHGEPGTGWETVEQYHPLDRREASRVLGEYMMVGSGTYRMVRRRVHIGDAVAPMEWECDNCHALMSCRLHFKGKGLCPACIAAAQ